MNARTTDSDPVELTVRLTRLQIAALSYVAVVVTSAVDIRVINAADAALRAIRETAALQVREQRR